MQEKLTKKQAIVYEFLLSEARKNGYPPGIRDICEALGMRSTATVHNHLTMLEQKGYIRRHPTRTRSIEILDKLEDEPSGAAKSGEVFVHIVPDEGLRAHGIIRGDIVVCRRGIAPQEGQVVAVWCEGVGLGLRLYDNNDRSFPEVVGVAAELRRRY